jgi:hypothetical protein
VDWNQAGAWAWADKLSHSAAALRFAAQRFAAQPLRYAAKPLHFAAEMLHVAVSAMRRDEARDCAGREPDCFSPLDCHVPEGHCRRPSCRAGAETRSLGTATRKQSRPILVQRVDSWEPAVEPSGSSRTRSCPAAGSRFGLDGAQKLGKQRAEKWEDEQQVHLLTVYRAMVRLTT